MRRRGRPAVVHRANCAGNYVAQGRGKSEDGGECAAHAITFAPAKLEASRLVFGGTGFLRRSPGKVGRIKNSEAARIPADRGSWGLSLLLLLSDVRLKSGVRIAIYF